MFRMLYLQCSLIYNVISKKVFKNTINQTPLYLNKQRCHPEEPNTSTLLVNNFFSIRHLVDCDEATNNKTKKEG